MVVVRIFMLPYFVSFSQKHFYLDFNPCFRRKYSTTRKKVHRHTAAAPGLIQRMDVTYDLYTHLVIPGRRKVADVLGSLVRALLVNLEKPHLHATTGVHLDVEV